MRVFYLNKHATCPRYIGSKPMGFSRMKVGAGERFSFADGISAMAIILQGQVMVSGSTFMSFGVGANQLFLMPAGVPHEVEVLDEVELLKLYIIGDKLEFCSQLFTGRYMDTLLQGDDWLSVLGVKPVVRQFADLLVQYIDDGLLCCDIHSLKQSELASLLQAYYETDALVRFLAPLRLANNDFFNSVVAISHEFLTIEQMAKRLFMSRSTFIRQFNTYFKESPNKWLARVRANALYKELRGTDVSLEDVAEHLRFSSQQSMSVFCKNHLGATPMQVRNGYVQLGKIKE